MEGFGLELMGTAGTDLARTDLAANLAANWNANLAVGGIGLPLDLLVGTGIWWSPLMLPWH